MSCNKFYFRALCIYLAVASTSGFVAPGLTSLGNVQRSQSLRMMVPLTEVSYLSIGDLGSTSDAIVTAASSLMVAETETWVQPLASVLGPFFNLFSFAMLCRVVISWYPNSDLNVLPYSLAAWPTEPLLRLIRGAVPPAFGVDITPIVWLGIFTFFNEILLGQQGLLTMKIKYGI